jgi:hypothetical protein
VKLAWPDRQVVALQGDGGFMFAQAESLWTMARYEVPIIVVVFDNRSYNGPRNKSWAQGGRQAQAGKDMSCYLGDPDVDFAKVAAGFGVAGEVVQAREQVEPAIRRAIRSTRDGKPYLIDAVIGRTGRGCDVDLASEVLRRGGETQSRVRRLTPARTGRGRVRSPTTSCHVPFRSAEAAARAVPDHSAVNGAGSAADHTAHVFERKIWCRELRRRHALVPTVQRRVEDVGVQMDPHAGPAGRTSRLGFSGVVGPGERTDVQAPLSGEARCR